LKTFQLELLTFNIYILHFSFTLTAKSSTLFACIASCLNGRVHVSISKEINATVNIFSTNKYRVNRQHELKI